MIPVLAAVLAVHVAAVDAAIVSKLDAGISSERERGAYALARLYDPDEYRDRDLLAQVASASNGAERAAVVEALADRDWGGAPPASVEKRIEEAFKDPDPGVRAAAVDALERAADDAPGRILPEVFVDARTSFDPRAMLDRLFALVERSADPARWKEATVTSAEVRLGSLKGAKPALDGPNARILAALAAAGVDVEPMLPGDDHNVGPPKSADFWRTTRANGVRAAAGDIAALSALVAVARDGEEPALRREATDLAMRLPPAPRAKALRALAGSTRDTDVLVRTLLLRAAVREPRSALTESILAAELSDAVPDLRFRAAAALADRSPVLGDASLAALTAARADADPLVHVAVARALAIHAAATPTPSPSPSPTPEPSPSPSPSPIASPSPSPSPTPYDGHPFPYPWPSPVHRPR